GVAVAEDAMVKTMAAEVPEAAPTDYSETNVQVEGIDEADIIKTDGEYIYTITGKTLFIIKAYPGEDAEIVSTMTFENRPNSLFINGDYLAVFGNYYDLDFFKEIDFTPRSGMTFFDIYDISDKEDPEILNEYKFEGRYFQGRMIGDYVYLVVTSTPDYRVGIPTPVIVEGVRKINMPVSDVYYYPLPYNNPQFATTHAVNLKDPQEDVNSKTVVIEMNPNMYMSHENIYITYTENINEYEIQQEIVVELMEPKLTDVDKQLIEKIRETDDDVLSKAEKDAKIMQIIQSYIAYLDSDEQDELEDEMEELLEERLEQYEYFEYTVIHKLSFDDGDISVEDTGKVPGHIINQFSMDEYKDVFRIGTTVNARWSRFDKQRTESTNHVLTLDEDLEILDHLADLAEGERIYSTRFMGDKLYMVTFRQVDPFFVIDLSDLENIVELGELKIPGFSRYLHPYDENTIIGIGRDATETGRTQGLKISLFDVSDVQNPEEVAKFVTEERYAQSTAEYEHKAFLFDREKELLVIPAYSYDYREGADNYNGAMVFKITRDEIELRGLIDHSDGSRRYNPAVERSLYIEELLYTKSPNLLRINSLLEDLESVKSIELKESYSGDIPIY
ncbi:MAG: beta-propeller domain-containing protein, partial [DPANN group archaeon]|nr:beta-propeller domain-containing protein [DPANN group archaeon]